MLTRLRHVDTREMVPRTRVPRWLKYGATLGVPSFLLLNSLVLHDSESKHPASAATIKATAQRLQGSLDRNISCPDEGKDTLHFKDGRRICLNLTGMRVEEVEGTAIGLTIPLASEPKSARMPVDMPATFGQVSVEACQAVRSALHEYANELVAKTIRGSESIPVRVVFGDQALPQCDDALLTPQSINQTHAR